MKKIAVMLMAVCMMSVAAPVFSAEMTKEEKDQCLLASKNCADEVDSIQKKIKKLNAEIKKGKKVYSAAEIKKLTEKLKEAQDVLDDLLGVKGGGN
jgi:peptidoglycan hydrolase CwlO-like protein